MEDPNFKKIIATVLLIALIVLSILVLKPIFTSIIIAMLLAFIFSPIYDWLNKRIKNPNISASIIIISLLLIIIVPIWFLTPILLEQAYNIFQSVSKIDFVTPLKSIFPPLFASEKSATEIGTIISSFTTRITNSFVNSIAQIILEFPNIMLHLLVIFFTLFFLLRDKEIVINYIKSILPFSKEIEERIFINSKNVTASVLYGEIIVGMLQGMILSIGLFIFKIPNALFYSVIAIILGVLPIIGTLILWGPLAIYLFSINNTIAAWGIVFFGVLSSNIDNILRPIIISKRTHLHSSIVLISMIGGLFFFGILGFVLGPLVISYLLILLEVYRGKTKPEIIIRENNKALK
ncbi:MAG: AI-2E family transporter [Candidatus Pacearchaeota archaeon]